MHRKDYWGNDNYWEPLPCSNVNSDLVSNVYFTPPPPGFICRVGPHDDPAPSSIGQLQRVLVAVLKESCTHTKSIILPIQLAALDSLMEMCPVGSPSDSTASVVGVVKEWLKVQMQHPWGHVLNEQLEQKLQSANTIK